MKALWSSQKLCGKLQRNRKQNNWQSAAQRDVFMRQEAEVSGSRCSVQELQHEGGLHYRLMAESLHRQIKPGNCVSWKWRGLKISPPNVHVVIRMWWVTCVWEC